MIVPMRKVYVVARNSEREQLLNTVRELGMIHLVPVDPARAVPDDATKRQMEMLQQALQNLSGVEPRGTAPRISAVEAAREVLEIRGSRPRVGITWLAPSPIGTDRGLG